VARADILGAGRIRMKNIERDWDGATYHRISEPQFRWGMAVLARVPLHGDETVLDAGAGSGRLTAELIERLPRGRVVAVDRSASMLDEARAHLARFGDRVRFVERDLLELDAVQEFDVVFSTAVFHWVLDHDRLFAVLFRALRPGGRLIAQCGAAGNLREIRALADTVARSPSFARWFGDWTEPWLYADAETTAKRLERAGFVDVRTSTEPAPTSFPDRATFIEFVERVVLRPHVARIPEAAEERRFLELVADLSQRATPPLTLDYKRLNMDARRP
jgi:trans-aconitate methyltransferase